MDPRTLCEIFYSSVDPGKPVHLRFKQGGEWRDVSSQAFRQAAESLMVDACAITRTTGETTDDDTGIVTPTTATVYTGKCRIQQSQLGADSTPSDPGEAYVRLIALELQLPMSVTGIRVQDVVTVTASVHDDDLVGRQFSVLGLAHKSHATARRIQVQEVAT